MQWVTSDLHFNHANIISYCHRPFPCLEDMNRGLIDNWNSVVHPHDTVYVLGDLAMGQPEKARYWIQQLEGEIILLPGNHDTNQRQKIYEECGITIVPGLSLDCGGVHFFCMHELPEVYTVGIEHLFTGPTCILYGHVHDAAPRGYHNNGLFHVGVDTNDFAPVSLEYIADEVKKTWNGKNDD